MKSWGMIICEHPRRPAVRKSEMRNSDEGGGPIPYGCLHHLSMRLTLIQMLLIPLYIQFAPVPAYPFVIQLVTT